MRMECKWCAVVCKGRDKGRWELCRETSTVARVCVFRDISGRACLLGITAAGSKTARQQRST